MTVYDELVARGLIAQVTDEEEIKELINNGKAVIIGSVCGNKSACHNDKSADYNSAADSTTLAGAH